MRFFIFLIGLIGVSILLNHFFGQGAAIVFVVFYLFIGGMILNDSYNKKAFKTAKEITESGKVISKTSGLESSGSTEYFVSFELPDGNRKNFKVEVDIFNTITENQVGKLTYRENGTRLFFVNFERQIKIRRSPH